jgi:hypothetical protein
MFLIAHGALGPYDELVYLGVAVIFIVMMGVSWFQTRMTDYDDDQHTEEIPTDIHLDEQVAAGSGEERFTLE